MPKHNQKILWAAGLAAAYSFAHPIGTCAEAKVDQREKILAARIKNLEDRIRRLQGMLNAKVENTKAAPSASTFSMPPKTGAENQSAEAATENSVAAPSDARASSSGAAPAKTVADAPKAPPPPPDDTTQELFVMRESAVTLKPRRLEIFSEIDYSSRRSALQTDNGFVNNTTIRYGLLDWLEFGVNVPYGFAARTTVLGPGNEAQYDAHGFGDIQAQLNARIMEQTRTLPGVVFSLAGIFPTGAKPYDLSHYALDTPGFPPTPNPVNPLVYNFSQGAWGVRTNIQLYKTVDPIIIFAGFGLTYIFPQSIDQYIIKLGLGYSYNMGISFAASESTTLGFSFNGGYTSAMKVNGRKVYGSSVYPAVSRLTIIQRLSQGVYLEPSLTFGLNQDVPNFTVGLGVRVRF